MSRFGLCLAALTCFTSVALGQSAKPADSTAAEAESAPDIVRRDKFVEKVTVKEVQRFLDPTRMINRMGYTFQANYLPSNVKLFSHSLRPWVVLSNRHALSVRIPYTDISLSDSDGPSGFGDITATWGFVIRKNLTSRLTTLAGGFDVLAPTGDFAKGTGFDTWVLAPGLLFVFNPTDLFPVNVIVRYSHSLDTKGDSGNAGLKVRTAQLTFQTFHILPRGFYLAFLPTFLWDLEQDFNVFSVGFGIGRALNRQLAFDVAYVQKVSGQETFSRGFKFGLKFLWGRDHGRP
jgi:hypothetical protein